MRFGTLNVKVSIEEVHLNEQQSAWYSFKVSSMECHTEQGNH
jgi:hypothetical protein